MGDIVGVICYLKYAKHVEIKQVLLWRCCCAAQGLSMALSGHVIVDHEPPAQSFNRSKEKFDALWMSYP